MAIIASVSLSQWLRLTQKARSNNLPLLVAPGTTLTGKIVPENNLPYVMIVAIQFDGVLAGQLAFEFVTGINRIAGYAVPSVIQDEILLSEKGQGINYTVSSSQTTSSVVNVDYLSMEFHVIDNELMPALLSRAGVLGVA